MATDGLVGTPEQASLLKGFEGEGGSEGAAFGVTKVISEPNWSSLLDRHLISPEQSELFIQLARKSPRDQNRMLAESQPMLEAMVNIMPDHTEPLQYILTILYEAVREDTRRLDSVCESLKNFDAIPVFSSLLHTPDIDTYTSDRAAFILTGIISRAALHVFQPDEVHAFIKSISEDPSSPRFCLSEAGRLSCFCNLLKLDANRQIMWDCVAVPQTLLRNLRIGVPIARMYLASFSVWLFSFNQNFVPKMTSVGITHALCLLIKETRIEKIVRVFLRTIKNFIKNNDASEIIVEHNVFQVLTLFEYEKWRDLDLYTEVREAIFQLDQKIKHFSNFDRYRLELDKGKLRWSILHSEKFWRENVMCFEEQQFMAVRKLAQLLSEVDPITVTVAAYDIGEFARFHPAGKKVCKNLKVKDVLMVLITSKDRAVARESLLCVQKLMLKNWKDAAGR